MSAETQIKNILNDWSLWPDLCAEKPSINQVSPLLAGLTNSNWLLEIENAKSNGIAQQYIIRINATNNLALKLNRESEWDMHQTISRYDICPAFLYRDPQDIYWIRPFLKTHTLQKTLVNDSSFIDTAFLIKVAKLFSTIHKIPTSNTWPKIHFLELIDHYWQQIEPQLNLPCSGSAQQLLSIRKTLDSQLKGPNFTPCLCHMDPNPSNWIINDQYVHLIDWEYAALGNKAWDLAGFIDSCQLNQQQVNVLLSHYKEADASQLKMASRQMKYLSALWFYVQNHLNDDSLLDELRKLIY